VKGVRDGDDRVQRHSDRKARDGGDTASITSHSSSRSDRKTRTQHKNNVSREGSEHNTDMCDSGTTKVTEDKKGRGQAEKNKVISENCKVKKYGATSATSLSSASDKTSESRTEKSEMKDDVSVHSRTPDKGQKGHCAEVDDVSARVQDSVVVTETSDVTDSKPTCTDDATAADSAGGYYARVFLCDINPPVASQ
jgi:hypothetical protein